jgi:tRNA(Ile)-lysidine synthase
MLTSKVKQTVERFCMLKPGDRVVVAVSGGPDSVCLLSVLQALAKDLNLVLHVAHLDHLFRGKESADEALFVAGLAEKLGIPATIGKIDVPAFCRERGLSSQEGARTARYDFFSRVVEATRASRIATGHTADDQAETFLMRLLRGAGVSGLSGIPPVRENIIRPLIEVTRQEVLEHIKEAGLAFVTDPSNSKPAYTRNKIRLDVLPVLKQFNPRLIETLASEAALLRDEDEAMEACLARLVPGIISREKDFVVFKREEFNALPQAFRRRLFKRAVDLAGAESSGLSSVQIDEALAFMAGAGVGRAMRLPHGLTVEREYGKFIISLQAASLAFSHTLALPGTTRIPEIGIEVETTVRETRDDGRERRDERAENYLWHAEFDYAKIMLPLMIRSRLRGDRFCPTGMGGRSKKLQDYFVDEKLPRRKRDAVPLLVSGDDVLWVAGLRTDERFLAGPETGKVLIVTMRNAEPAPSGYEWHRECRV